MITFTLLVSILFNQLKAKDVEKILEWEKTSLQDVEIPFKPARIILQDFTYYLNLIKLY